MIDIIEFSEKYSIDVRKIDKQNKKLFEIINEFDNAIGSRNEDKIISKTLDSLFDYAFSYFKKEEELLEQYKYPDYIDHASEHNRIISNVFEIYKGYKNGEDDIAYRIAFLLGYWLNDHLLIEDKKYGKYLNSKGVN